MMYGRSIPYPKVIPPYNSTAPPPPPINKRRGDNLAGLDQPPAAPAPGTEMDTITAINTRMGTSPRGVLLPVAVVVVGGSRGMVAHLGGRVIARVSAAGAGAGAVATRGRLRGQSHRPRYRRRRQRRRRSHRLAAARRHQTTAGAGGTAPLSVVPDRRRLRRVPPTSTIFHSKTNPSPGNGR